MATTSDRMPAAPRRRPVALIASLWFATGGAAPPDAAVDQRTASEPIALSTRVPDPPAAPVAETVAADEGTLRRRLADDADPSEAALLLAALLDREERIGEALTVMDVALGRRPDDAVLLAAKAGILRDLGRRDDALAILGSLAGKTLGLQPELLLEWAELAAHSSSSSGDTATALRALDRAAAASPDAAATAQIERLRQGIAAGGTLVPTRVRDLFGELRGSPDSERRGAAFSALLAVGGEVAQRAVAAILDDADPELRSRGVRLAEVPANHLVEFCALALGDPAQQVRLAGAERVVALPAVEAAGLLLPALAAETDPLTFAELHAALRRVTGQGRELTPSAAADAGVRATVVAEWRRQWER